ncbi:MAG: thiamine diphosphokinase [Acidobacteriota bacterium]
MVVANAPWRWHLEHVELVRLAGLVLAADGGANHLARIGVRPAAVIGDLDSILPRVRLWVGEERLVPRPDQDHTDLHKTLSYAFDERGAKRVTVLAATGGRLDHAVENLALLARWAGRGELVLAAEDADIWPVVGRARFATRAGQTISIIPMGRCERVWAQGLEWPLDGEPLDLSVRTGVCNRATGAAIEVAVEGGVVLVFFNRQLGNWTSRKLHN